MLYDKDTTARDVVEAWDKGESVWSIELGGLGPGYEQAIQVLIIELLRDNLDKDFPADDDEAGWTAWDAANRKWGDDTVHRIDKTCGGFSGAQVGQAKSFALHLLRKGYGPAMMAIKKKKEFDDRQIQVSKRWPHAPEPAGAAT